MKTFTSALLTAAAAFSVACVAQAADAPAKKPAAKKAAATKEYRAPPMEASSKLPDWRGVWAPHERNMFDPASFTDPRNKGITNAADMREYPPYNAEWEAKYVKVLADNKKGVPTDPHANCLPGGMPRTIVIPYPHEVVVTPKVTYWLLEETSAVRRIFTDGRKHPVEEDFGHPFQGHSIGHWEGDTLVADTVYMKDYNSSVFDVTAAPHSDKVHTVERIRRISPTQMEDIMTVEDPIAFTKPWVIRRLYDLKPTWEITEYICEENNRNPLKADGSTTTGVVAQKN